ncbi:MAG: helix-turn-helix domain-containing protein [Chloroflexota bacterium]
MFNDWLLNQMQQKEWSQADLARHSGLTKGAISKYINGRIPDEAAIRKIARALKISPETVFRAAGLLPPQSPETELINQISHLTSELPEQEQQDILEFVKLRHRLAEERGKNATRRTASHPTTPK